MFFCRSGKVQLSRNLSNKEEPKDSVYRVGALFVPWQHVKYELIMVNDELVMSLGVLELMHRLKVSKRGRNSGKMSHYNHIYRSNDFLDSPRYISLCLYYILSLLFMYNGLKQHWEVG